MKNLMVIFVILFSCPLALARSGNGIVISANGMYLTTTNTTASTTTTSNRTLLDGVLGYRFSSPIFLGGTYDSDSMTTSTTGSSDSIVSATAYGVTGGYDNGNFYLLGTYFIGSEYDSTSSNIKTAFTGGTGFQGTIGYRFNVSSHFAIGPQFSYRSLSYTTMQVGSAPSSSVTFSYSTFVPYLNFTYSFGGGSSSDD